ncbi:NAD(P)-binding protein [Aspergillus brunneoviolaceus CBS 621.78]|uniref:NAD(P)-binding protein n=1 Tax=Aspergillus brunneoviolaceus CBS 621.78 TaxID=1450534 RepID=A0ACD1GDE9_9EURO|nr:NAD(P)-binding protein [Aspergillus brunneoviolaceus CBS 621.78]RAH47304.1 NAD(P)-binding protein [Aspergillus brunneoviolaceus CBS 621.78]
MTISENRNIIIVGVGSLMSKSLALWLASLGWNIALISRSEQNLSAIAKEVREAQKSPAAKVLYRTADAGEPASLTAALDWCLQELGGTLDVLCYNAARVTVTDITSTRPEELQEDFKISAVGTLVAGQWFAGENHARVDRVAQGEWPLFLVTGGTLDKEPQPIFASLSSVKAASQTLSRLFAEALPDKAKILVGMPLITGRVVSPGTEGYQPKFDPGTVVASVFKPFFEDREARWDGKLGWVVERYH